MATEVMRRTFGGNCYLFLLLADWWLVVKGSPVCGRVALNNHQPSFVSSRCELLVLDLGGWFDERVHPTERRL
jgi:hypothetical protein